MEHQPSTPEPAHIRESKRQMAERAELLKSGKAALCFSTGKDSAAALLLLRPYLEHVHVVFVNTGKYLPETLAIADMAKQICPKWVEVKTDRDAQWNKCGLPTDLRPEDWTVENSTSGKAPAWLIQGRGRCCTENVAKPLGDKLKELGVSLVIRGHRNDESHVGMGKSGTQFDGFTLWNPLEHWTRWNALDYIRQELGTLPAHYYLEHTSLDCYDCTGFTGHSYDRTNYLRTYHPELHRDYIAKLSLVHQAARGQMEHYETLVKWQITHQD